MLLRKCRSHNPQRQEATDRLDGASDHKPIAQQPNGFNRNVALPLEQNDEWAVQRRYMSLETLGSVSDTASVSLPAVAA